MICCHCVQASYINEPLAARDNTSEDEDGYVQPNTTDFHLPLRPHGDDADDDDDDKDDNTDESDDAEEEEGDAASDCNTLSHRGRRPRNKKYHDYINVLTCHH